MILKFEAPDLAPDPELGVALGALLPVVDRRAFRERVVARAAGIPQQPWWAVLDRWARPAFAAAAAITAAAWIAGGAFDRAAPENALTLDGVMISSATGSAPAELMLAAPRPPDPDAVFASLFSQ